MKAVVDVPGTRAIRGRRRPRSIEVLGDRTGQFAVEDALCV